MKFCKRILCRETGAYFQDIRYIAIYIAYVSNSKKGVGFQEIFKSQKGFHR
jgi:hypothetical protein